jgi:hypothetical protein
MRARLGYANIASTLALVIALGSGGAYAAGLSKNSVRSKQIKDHAIKTVDLALGSVTGETLSDGSVSSTKVGDGSVTSVKLADGAVVTTKLADGSVVTGKLVNGAVITSKLADGSVVTGKLGDGSVTTAKIADGTVTAADLDLSSQLFAVTITNGTTIPPSSCITRSATSGVFLPAGKLTLAFFTTGTIPDNIAFFGGTTKDNAGVGSAPFQICNTSTSTTATFTGATFNLRIKAVN